VAVQKIVTVVLALGVVVAAVAWASVPFTDRAYSCGTAVGEWQHGVKAPTLHALLPSAGDQVSQSGVGVLTTNTPFVTLCRGQARGRLAESGAVIGIAVGAVVLSRRRWGGPGPKAAPIR
jgi:hypothetical protein